MTAQTKLHIVRYFIELSYNGTLYSGWQEQPNAPTVQAALNKAFSILLHKTVFVVGAGRTDAGVHARFFVAHLEVDEVIEEIDFLIYKLNRLLHKSIAIHKIYLVEPKKNARFSAVSRTYKYFINKTKDPFTCEFAIRVYPLPDVQRMNEACSVLLEYTDFTSFTKSHTETKTNNCKLMYASWEDEGNQLIFTITANRFLRNMVRAIVGTMISVGQGKISIDELRQIIESKNRCNAGASVPGRGLFLWDVKYEENLQELHSHTGVLPPEYEATETK
ncbi:tRNA pseudouridine synthase A [Bacteroidia bacterium]|nr:tRNA pseudouridine synthase A [Bacteroidia bacterium]